MDKNQGIGILLLFAVIVAYYVYTSPSQADIERQQYAMDSIERVQLKEQETVDASIPAVEQEVAIPDSVKRNNLSGQYGPFAQAMVGESIISTLENDLIKLSFDSKGGKIKEAILKKHYKVVEDSAHVRTKKLLSLLKDEKNKFEFLIPTQNYGNINTSDLIFAPSKEKNTLSMTARLSDGNTITQSYTLKDDSYHIDYSLQLNGINQLIDKNDSNVKMRWHNYLDKIEINTNFEKYYSTVYYKENNESSDYCSCRSDDKTEINSKKIEWFSHVNQFFNTSIIAVNKKFENGVFETVMLDEDQPDLKLLKTEADIPLDLVNNESIQYSMYVGPNEYKNLKSYGNELEQIIPFGRSIFGTINRHIIRPFFDWLSSFIGSKGLVIILLIFIIKMLLYPLMYKMLHSQAKMGALKPQLAHLKTKYKDEPQKVQMETMKIYREYGVSPLGGCMPMILQMPIWYALFRFFPASITFRQEPFLWATDLSSYDVFFRLPFEIPAYGAHISMFTLLWAATTIIYSYYNMRHMDMSANPAMKYVQYFMPITFLFFFNNYASGLTCYMFFSNTFNIAQTILTKRFIFDDERLLAELNVQKAKPKKKNTFQERLEKAMAEQQRVKAQQDAQRSKKKRK